jgi:hypothetical protein
MWRYKIKKRPMMQKKFMPLFVLSFLKPEPEDAYLSFIDAYIYFAQA